MHLLPGYFPQTSWKSVYQMYHRPNFYSPINSSTFWDHVKDFHFSWPWKSIYLLESCVGWGYGYKHLQGGCENPQSYACGWEQVELGTGKTREKKLFVWMLTQCMWKWHKQEIQCYRELVVQGWSIILKWLQEHRWELRDCSDHAINTFCICRMATSAANEQELSMDGHVVNSKRINLHKGCLKDFSFLLYSVF